MDMELSSHPRILVENKNSCNPVGFKVVIGSKRIDISSVSSVYDNQT